MVVDSTVILMAMISLWIGWSIRLSIDWISLVWIALFTLIITFLLPYFMAFVDQSSAAISPVAYYVFGIVVMALIFLSFYLFIAQKKSASSGLKRVVGSMVLAVVSTYAYIIVLMSMAQYGWVNTDHSILIGHLPSWILSPFK